MKTIVLKDKKSRIKNWVKRVLIIAAAAVLVGLIGSLRIKYQYYEIDYNLNKTILGVSSNKFIKNETEIELFSDYTEEYLIGTYNYSSIIDYKMIITWKWTKENDEQIASAISNSVYPIVYVCKITDNEEKIDSYIKDKKCSEAKEKLSSDKYTVSSAFVDVNKIASEEETDKLLNSTIDKR